MNDRSKNIFVHSTVIFQNLNRSRPGCRTKLQILFCRCRRYHAYCSTVMKKCRFYKGIHSRRRHIHSSGDHSTKNRNTDTVFISKIIIASQILYKINLLRKVGIIFNHQTAQPVQPFVLFIRNDQLQIFLYTEHRHRLKTLEIDILFRHRRQWFCRLQYIQSHQSEITNTIYRLHRKFRITIIKQHSIFIINRFAKTHSRFEIINFHK